MAAKEYGAVHRAAGLAGEATTTNLRSDGGVFLRSGPFRRSLSLLLLLLVSPFGVAFQSTRVTIGKSGAQSAMASVPSSFLTGKLLHSSQSNIHRSKRRWSATTSSSSTAAIPQTKEQTIHDSAAAAEAVQPTTSKNNSSSPDNASTIASLEKLQRYKTNKDIERTIVRLGRKGRTDDALELYRSLWILDGLRHRHRSLHQTILKQSGMDDESTKKLKMLFDDGETIPASLLRYLSASKLRPTTRLMNAAIDACSRSQPPARQIRAFRIFDEATSPVNSADGSKKPGGALSPNVFTFGSLLACCARNGDVDASVELLRMLEDGTRYPDVVVNEVIYSTVISACERCPSGPKVELALRILNRATVQLAKRSGGKDSMGVVGFNAAISAMARSLEWKMALQLLGEMILHSSKHSKHAATAE
eukprot:CAMPEP_0183748252 /NCGR_PEP_ID=MMETSP0737-20130205/67677_1 /TAXON_ID=385413 /ORGANISM="Thalassiosira miniscula, Strain CCMP1093" /LENGTH=418 /DNA_ID=CAMNT_0025983971 /DNA_START=634 /DNA_END=1886 /DNA_ORIENTATION=-